MQIFTIATQFRRADEDKVAGEIVIETIEVADLNAASAYAADINKNGDLPFFIRSVAGDNGQYVRFSDPTADLGAVPVEEPLWEATVRFSAEGETYGTVTYEIRASDEAAAIRLAGERAETDSHYADPRIDYVKEIEVEQIEVEDLPLAA